MTRLSLQLAPKLDIPRRFLAVVPLWGIVGGLLLLLDGTAVAESRWHPATVAVTHVFTLGVLANTLFGSLLQFLPAAMGAALNREAALSLPTWILLNGGTVLLTTGFRASNPALLPIGGMSLAFAFVLLGVMTLPGLLSATHAKLVRAGIAGGIIAGVVTMSLAVLLVGALSGHWQVPHPLVVVANVHATWGIAGWLLLPTASVASIVMPMFQGTAAPPEKARLLWLVATVGTLIIGTVLYCLRGESLVLRIGTTLCATGFAGGVLILQWRSEHRRNPVLREFWATGAGALLVAAVASTFDVDETRVGLLVIAGALPLFTVGMQLQITAFLAWLDLQRRSGGGHRLPSVQRLLDDSLQRRVLRAQQIAGGLVASALVGAAPYLIRAAGLAFAVTFLLLGFAQHTCRRRANEVEFMKHEGASA
jgi:hypothetical protein